ncbi:MAG: hypothetical protein OXU61_00610 [Gammaproteobacteria bacterium]|nr:hypothetical protein [Gammaproteobacteria bacterium]
MPRGHAIPAPRAPPSRGRNPRPLRRPRFQQRFRPGNMLNLRRPGVILVPVFREGLCGSACSQ